MRHPLLCGAAAYAYVADGNGCLLVRDTLQAMGFKLQRAGDRDRLPKCLQPQPSRAPSQPLSGVSAATSGANGAHDAAACKPQQRGRGRPPWYLRWVPYPSARDTRVIQHAAAATHGAAGAKAGPGSPRVLFNHVTPVPATLRLVDKAGLLRLMRCAGLARDTPPTFNLADVRDQHALADLLRSQLHTNGGGVARDSATHDSPAVSSTARTAAAGAAAGHSWWLVKPPRGSKGRGLQLVRGDSALLRAVCAFTGEGDAASVTGPAAGAGTAAGVATGAAGDAAGTPTPAAAGARACDADSECSCAPVPLPSACLVQQYQRSPLTLSGCKLDLRVFVLVARTRPMLVLYCDGYARRCVERYRDPSAAGATTSGPLYSHLTNLSLQKRHPRFASAREELAMCVPPPALPCCSRHKLTLHTRHRLLPPPCGACLAVCCGGVTGTATLRSSADVWMPCSCTQAWQGLALSPQQRRSSKLGRRQPSPETRCDASVGT